MHALSLDEGLAPDCLPHTKQQRTSCTKPRQITPIKLAQLLHAMNANQSTAIGLYLSITLLQ
jgi:hypothetical protein